MSHSVAEHNHIDGLLQECNRSVQDCSISTANALEILQSFTNLSIRLCYGYHIVNIHLLLWCTQSCSPLAFSASHNLNWYIHVCKHTYAFNLKIVSSVSALGTKSFSPHLCFYRRFLVSEHNILVSQTRALLAACREPAGNVWQLSFNPCSIYLHCGILTHQ